MVSTGGPTNIVFYVEDLSWHGALCTPTANCEKAKGHVLHFLHIPLVLFKLIKKEGCPIILHKILAIITKHLKDSGANKDQGKAWELIAKWCVMAAQKDAQGDSLVAFKVEAIMEGDDFYFKQWVEQQLNAIMGAQLAQETRVGADLAAQSPPVPAQFAAELSKGLALRLKLLGQLKPPTLSQGGHADMDTKQGYSDKDVAALTGFAHMKHGN
jgi:hypothetical protein